MTDNKATAKAALRIANDHAGEATVYGYPAAWSLVGIGYALLALADAAASSDALPCAIPDDCPLGPEPHPFAPPVGEGLCCARQPWEAGQR